MARLPWGMEAIKIVGSVPLVGFRPSLVSRLDVPDSDILTVASSRKPPD